MKKILIFITLCFGAMNSIGQAPNKPDLDKMLNWVYTDTKSEVILTNDVGGNKKIWNLADGKLLFSYAKGDASVFGKMLRYGIVDNAFTNRNVELKTAGINDSWVHHYYENKKQLFYGITITPDVSSRFMNLHLKTKQAAYSLFKDKEKAAYFYAVNNPDDSTGSENSEEFKELVKIKYKDGKYYGIEFSPSGKYIYTYTNYSTAVCLIDVEKKDVLWKNKNWKSLNTTGDEFVFNKDETNFAAAYDKGILILDINSGKLLDSVLLPDRFKLFKNGKIFPCSDMKSFVFIQQCYKGSDVATCSPKGWLIRKNEIIELEEK